MKNWPPSEFFSPDDPLPPPHLPFVGLFAAETAGYLAFTVALLDAELRAISPNLLRAVREEIDLRVLGPEERYLDGFLWREEERPEHVP